MAVQPYEGFLGVREKNLGLRPGQFHKLGTRKNPRKRRGLFPGAPFEEQMLDGNPLRPPIDTPLEFQRKLGSQLLMRLAAKEEECRLHSGGPALQCKKAFISPASGLHCKKLKYIALRLRNPTRRLDSGSLSPVHREPREHSGRTFTFRAARKPRASEPNVEANE